MINSNEVRRGNLVNVKERFNKKGEVLPGLRGPFQIEEIKNNGLGVLHLPSPRLPFFFWFKELEGIPLTPEIVDKVDAGHFSAICYKISVAGGLIFYYGPFEKWQIEIEFLHQLQNHYFALTGKELDIKNLLK